MFNRFRIAKYKIKIVAGNKGLLLPPYKGSTFRGGFGSVFRRIICSTRNNSCPDCILNQRCAYAYIFETAPPPDTKALSKYESIPRPFVIEPPLETKTDYLPGETLYFNLILIGKAIDFLPYFIITFREMGEMGLGRGRRSYTLDTVTAVGLSEEELIYSAETKVVRSIDCSFTASQIIEKFPAGIKKIRVEFITPIRLKNSGKIVSAPKFDVLFRQAMRRISALAYFHHDNPLDADYAGLSNRSCSVVLTANNTIWQDWERYSSRQQQRINIGGIVGSVAYEGELDEFMPWLAIGEQIHVGKNTVFGLGKYALNIMIGP